MKDQIKTLLRRIRRWHNGSSHADIAMVPGPTALPPPQITWVLLALVHYACRKLWAWRTLVPKIVLVAERYPDEGVAQAVNTNRMKSGNVPDSRHWTYVLDGGQLYLTNMAVGERIEINIHNGPELIEIDSFCAVVRAQLFPEAAVQRFGELFPSGGLLAAFNRLREYGAFHVQEAEPGGDVLSLYLHDSLLKYPDAVRAFLMAWDQPENRIALASLISDWPALQRAATALGQADLATRAGVLAEQARRRWLTVLRMDAENGLCESTLCALADAGAEDLPDYLEPALANPSLAATAIAILDRGSTRHGQRDGKDGMK